MIPSRPATLARAIVSAIGVWAVSLILFSGCAPAAITSTPVIQSGTQTAPTLNPTEIAQVTSATLSATTPILPTRTPSPTVRENEWRSYQDPTYGLRFQYLPDWTQSVALNYPLSKSLLKRIAITHLDRAAGDNAEILVDVRMRHGDLLDWFQQMLRTQPGRLFITPSSVEGGVESFTDYNARLAGRPAIFAYAPEHGSGTPDMAQVYVADDQYFYVFTYFGDIPDNPANRATYLRLLETVSLADSTTRGLSLPETSFTEGVTLGSTQVPMPVFPPAEVLGISPSPPSMDRVLLAREDGSLALHELANGQERVILDPGLYPVSGDAHLVPILWPIRLSPDGRWLIVPTPNDGTWLVSLDGQVRRQINEERLQATWAPDSRRIVFTREKGPAPREEDHNVYIQDLMGSNSPQMLARLPGSASPPAWSPGCDGLSHNESGDCGRSIAVFSRANDLGYGNDYTAWLIDVTSGEARELGHFVPPPVGGTLFPTWSPTGDEIETRGWLAPIAFAIDGSGPRPLDSACQSSNCGELSLDGTLLAWLRRLPDQPNRSRLAVGRAGSNTSVIFDTVYEQVEAVRWTSDGRRVLVSSFTSGAYALWAVDPAIGQPELAAERITFLGTLDDLRQRSTEVGAYRASLVRLPKPGDPSTWTVRELAGLGVRLRVPLAWRFETQGGGITETATLSNFYFVGPIGNASLGPEHMEITFQRVSFAQPSADFTAWLSQTVAMEQNQVKAESTTVAGRPAARVRTIVSPVSEQVRVLLDGGTELWIIRRPLASAQDAVFEQILNSLELIPTPTGLPNPMASGWIWQSSRSKMRR